MGVKMKIQLSDHFTYKKLLKFVFPSITMMVFTSIYSVVDGLFISNFTGKTPFAAINLIIPFTMILGAIGFMFGTGGSALVAKTLGEGDKPRANKIFSLLVYSGIVTGVILSVLGLIFIEPIARFIGAEDNMISYCVEYGSILLLSLPAFILQNMFQSFMVTAEKPTMGLVLTVIAGIANIILDTLLVAVFDFGVVGAAIATAISQCIGGFAPLIYFAKRNTSLLKLTKTSFNARVIARTCSNGMSELVTNVSLSFVSMLYNFQLMRFEGENGVAAYGVIMYVNFIFIAIFLGYSIGSAPIVGFHYGAGNINELKGILKKSLVLISISGITLSLLAVVLSSPLSAIFVGYDKKLFDMTVNAFILYAVSYLFCGFSIFGSAFFTALNNGVVSAIISFLRTLLFQVAAVLILPVFFEFNGIWYSVGVSEFFALIVTVIAFVTMRKKYKYF